MNNNELFSGVALNHDTRLLRCQGKSFGSLACQIKIRGVITFDIPLKCGRDFAYFDK